MPERKSGILSLPFELKATDPAAATTGDARTFEGFLSTSHLDLGDGWMKDIVWPGAFKRWAANFKKSKDKDVPLLDSHDRFSVFSAIGQLEDVEEQLTGQTNSYEVADDSIPPKSSMLEVPEMKLWTRWRVVPGDDGDKILARLRDGIVRRMSMGYDAIKEDFGRLVGGDRFRNLREVRVREGSLVVFAMQPNATVDLASVKEYMRRIELSADRALTEQERSELQDIKTQIDGLLSTAEEEAPPSSDPDPALLAKHRELQRRIERLTRGRRLDDLVAMNQ